MQPTRRSYSISFKAQVIAECAQTDAPIASIALSDTPLPTQFPRALIHHEPDNSHCQCGCAPKRIGEDASEKLDYMPAVSSSTCTRPIRADRRKSAALHRRTL
ncbi:hypothetical protein FPT12_20210 [Pseudomonas sp. H3(2019)]|nr:hypothetical protein FPT12_20210 [Pseudomonas sp. H3(2019)]